MASSVDKLIFLNKDNKISRVIDHDDPAVVTAMSPFGSKDRFSVQGYESGVIDC